MKYWKIFLLLATSFTIHTSTNAQKTSSAAYHWLNFQWMGATVSGRAFPKAAIFLSIQVSGLKGNFTAQFDLGSDVSELYGNSIINYYPSHTELFRHLDTLNKGSSDGSVTMYPVKTLSLSAGGYTIPDVFLADKFGDEVPKDSLFTASAKNIGTIGASFVKNKVLVIDFPNHRMCLLDSVDRYWLARTTFVTGRLRKGRMQLPFTINGKVIWILFDTGASIYPLLVDKALWTVITDPNAPIDSIKSNSWGEQVTFYGAPMKMDLYLGAYRLPKANAWYDENKRLQEFNRQEDISGITGNAYFLHNIIVIDFKTNRFGVVRKDQH